MIDIQEYNLNIKLATIFVRGQWLCKLATKAQDQEDVNNVGRDNEWSLYAINIFYIIVLHIHGTMILSTIFNLDPFQVTWMWKGEKNYDYLSTILF